MHGVWSKPSTPHRKSRADDSCEFNSLGHDPFAINLPRGNRYVGRTTRYRGYVIGPRLHHEMSWPAKTDLIREPLWFE